MQAFKNLRETVLGGFRADESVMDYLRQQGVKVYQQPTEGFWGQSVSEFLRGEQFGDDANFSNGTVQGKRIRIVGAGNIASRYASFVSMLGADNAGRTIHANPQYAEKLADQFLPIH